MLHACILFRKTTVSAIICSSELCTKKQTTKNGKNHENLNQNRRWWRDCDVINHVVCFHTATELCSWYDSCNIKSNNHTDTKMRENRIKYDLRGIPRFGGIMCSKKSRQAPTKIEDGFNSCNISKNQTCTPFSPKPFDILPLRYWTILWHRLAFVDNFTGYTVQKINC